MNVNGSVVLIPNNKLKIVAWALVVNNIDKDGLLRRRSVVSLRRHYPCTYTEQQD